LRFQAVAIEQTEEVKQAGSSACADKLFMTSTWQRRRYSSPKMRTTGSRSTSFLPERVVGAVADDEHGVARVLDGVAQMVEDPARLAHARRRQHDHREAARG
jgi:hypothetical protein